MIVYFRLIIDYCISHRGTEFAEKRFYYLKERNRSQAPRFRFALDGSFDRVQRSGLRTTRGMGGGAFGLSIDD